MEAKKIKLAALMLLMGSQILLADQAEDVAKKLANPAAAMISLPIQVNYLQNIGLDDKGEKWATNIQPVIPVELNDDWNLITRTIVPLVSQSRLFPGAGTQNGIGDITATAWFSPRLPTESGWIWGAGPAFLIPTGSDVSALKWGIGPSAIVLKQNGPWTYGGLVNHIWSTGGSDGVLNDISTTFMQPFVSYVTPQAVTVSLASETTYDWKQEQWFVPINATVSKVGKIGNQLVSYGGGVSYIAESSESAPKGWGARFVLTFIFPKYMMIMASSK